MTEVGVRTTVVAMVAIVCKCVPWWLGSWVANKLGLFVYSGCSGSDRHMHQRPTHMRCSRMQNTIDMFVVAVAGEVVPASFRSSLGPRQLHIVERGSNYTSFRHRRLGIIVPQVFGALLGAGHAQSGRKDAGREANHVSHRAILYGMYFVRVIVCKWWRAQ